MQPAQAAGVKRTGQSECHSTNSYFSNVVVTAMNARRGLGGANASKLVETAALSFSPLSPHSSPLEKEVEGGGKKKKTDVRARVT